MLSKELISKWIAALRSNEYPQSYCQMRQPLSFGGHAYCALGVLLEVSDIPNVWDCRSHRGLILKSLGMNEDTYSMVVQWNDVDRYNFFEIADFIENRSL